METNDIVFCNGKGNNIINDREKTEILSLINEYININYMNNYIYSDKLLKNLNKYEYLLSPITIGNNYWLFLTNYKNQNYTFLIDRKIIKGHKYPKILIVNIR